MKLERRDRVFVGRDAGNHTHPKGKHLLLITLEGNRYRLNGNGVITTYNTNSIVTDSEIVQQFRVAIKRRASDLRGSAAKERAKGGLPWEPSRRAAYRLSRQARSIEQFAHRILVTRRGQL